MSITAERKAELIQQFKTSENDRGSAQVQVAILTERIRNITDHLRTMKKEFASRRRRLVLLGREALCDGRGVRMFESLAQAADALVQEASTLSA